MSTYQNSKHSYSNYLNEGLPKIEQLDKIEDVLAITDSTEMDNNIFKNILTITKILKCIYKHLCDNYFLNKEEIDLLIYALKFLDTMNLFMNKQSIEQISGLIYHINEIIFSMHDFEAKEMILKKIRYTEMTIIYFKKKYFRNLFFGDGKVLGNEIEKCLELVNQNGTFDQKTFKQMQNIFYVVQGKIDEKYRSEIQNKMNELKILSLRHKNEKYSINDDYKDYTNSKNFANDDYYENFNEDNMNNNMDTNTNAAVINANPNLGNNTNNNNNYQYHKSYDNNSGYNNYFDYYNGKKSISSNNKHGNYKNKYYNYNNPNANKNSTYIVEVELGNTIQNVPNESGSKSSNQKVTEQNLTNVNINVEEKNQNGESNVMTNTQNYKDNSGNYSNPENRKNTSEHLERRGNVSQYDEQTRSQSNGPKNIQNYYNDNFFKNYVYYYEKPQTTATSNAKETTNIAIVQPSSPKQAPSNPTVTKQPVISNNNPNHQIEFIPSTTINSNANTATPVKVNSNKQQRNKYKRNKNATYEQVIYSDNVNYNNNYKATENTQVGFSNESNKAEEVPVKNTELEEASQQHEINPVNVEKEIPEKVKTSYENNSESNAENSHQQGYTIQTEIHQPNQNYNKKYNNNNYNNYKYNNKNYPAYNNNYNYQNYNYSSGNYYTKNNYYNTSANTNNTAYDYDYNYNNYGGSNKTYKNEADNNFNNQSGSVNNKTNKDSNINVPNFNNNQHYNYNYNSTNNYKKNSINHNNTVVNQYSQGVNYYNNNVKNSRVKNNAYTNKYKNSYDYNRKNENVREIDTTKQTEAEIVENTNIIIDSNLCQNVVEDVAAFVNKEEKDKNEKENVEEEMYDCQKENVTNEEKIPEVTVSNQIENKIQENKAEQNINDMIKNKQDADVDAKELDLPASISHNVIKPNQEIIYQDQLNLYINRKELVDVDVEKMFAADVHPRHMDSDAYNEENYDEEDEDESAEEEFEDNEEEDEEIQCIIENEIEQINARHAENQLMNEEDEEGDSDSGENEMIEQEYDKFMRESKMGIANNPNYSMKNEDNYYGLEEKTKNNKIIFEDDELPTQSNQQELITKKNEIVEPATESKAVNISENENSAARKTSDPHNSDSNTATQPAEERNMKDTTKNFMDSLKNIDPKLLTEIKNKINENNKERENEKAVQNNWINSQFNQFNMQQNQNFQNATTPMYSATHVNPLNMDPTSTTSANPNQNQLSYEDFVKHQQMNLNGMNNKLQLQNFIFTNYSHFFYRGRDSNIHREYFALKCLEQENSSIITNNLDMFEKKILIPIYQRINYNVNKKKGIYHYTFTKYKKLIYRVLTKEKILKKVKPYGSYMNNFLIDSGDIDICIVPKCSILDFSASLEKIKEEITQNNYGEHKLTHHTSRYMLLKIIDNQTKFVIDITVHNMLPILNTNLLRLYSLYDQRFHILGLYIKHWSKINKLHGAADNYLSSYAMLMMLIYFLQNVVEPKVLPNLQRVEKKETIYEFNQNGEMVKTNIYYEEDVQKIRNYLSNINNGRENKESATQLLLKFFEFYSYYFDYYEQKIAIHKMPNELLKKTHDNIAFSIEDPFDPHHNPGKSMLINSTQFNKFVTAMKKEINLIMNGEYIKRLEKMSSSN